jgi:GT2 family glycosyltransferase
MHSISFIVSNFNGAKYLPRLLESLKAQQGVTLEIIIVDRDSKDDSLNILAAHPEVCVVQHPPEHGLVSGYAEGFKHASQDLVFFSNEDMWFAPDCLRLCAEALLSDDRVGAVMPTQLRYDGQSLYCCGIWFAASLWNRALTYPFRKSAYHRIKDTARVSFANAGACLMRRTAYQQAGGWDTTFFLDDEDTDLGLRLWQMDWKCLSVAGAVLGHAVGASNTQTIPNVGTVVGKKRYAHGLSNFLAIGIKSFSPAAVMLPFICFADRLLRNVLRMRLQLALLDVQGLWLTFCRLPQLLESRRSRAGWNARKPGQGFFKEPEFDYSRIAANKHGAGSPDESN